MPRIVRSYRPKMDGPDCAHLGNWRDAPYNQWAFHHVRELIPTARVRNDPANIRPLPRQEDGQFVNDELSQTLRRTWTDAFMVLRRGTIVYEWYAPHYDGADPHILFSVSKSITGSLAGVLVDKGQLDVDQRVAAYLPADSTSAYADCTVRHLLDMQVGLDFAEVYSGENTQFNRYRAATGWNPPPSGEPPGDLRSFLNSISHSATPDGTVFEYMSPNTDMLGLILESASGQRFSDLLSACIWRPMGAESDAYITVDAKGAPRAAGGICVRPQDLARFGQLMCDRGHIDGRQIISLNWIEDTLRQGSYQAWQQGSFSHLIPKGRYRNQWYQIGNATGAFCAIGIHGQWIYVDPTVEVVIVKLSSQPDPADDDIDTMLLSVFDKLSTSL